MSNGPKNEPATQPVWTAPPIPPSYEHGRDCGLCYGTKELRVDGRPVRCTGCDGEGTAVARERVGAELQHAAWETTRRMRQVDDA